MVEFEQHAVLAELGLAGTEGLMCCEVFIHFFQALKAFGHVFSVDFGIKERNGLFTEVVGTVHVEASALLDQ